MDIQRRRPEPHFHAVNELSKKHALRAKEIMLSRNGGEEELSLTMRPLIIKN